ncbi:MAG: hypothetical protein HDS93_04920 [Bacteroidales bacterium]|nr:hypothetical protein [Bacteroidales bacterium]MBD5209231.1 hypothetical protein [Bacteroidales bacterium]MDE6083017.1 hypothetical protein [Muribaculaceae bacterium]
MITDQVIKEIYKVYIKPPKDRAELRLDYFRDLLAPNHDLGIDDDEIIINNLEEFNPFRRFLIRSINAILEFDKFVAIVFRNHILFMNKEDSNIRIHIRPEKPKKNIFSRIFGGR